MLQFVTNEYFHFGLVLTALSGDWRSAPALVLLLEFVLSAFALHKRDAPTPEDGAKLLYEVAFAHAFAVFAGVFVGLAYVYATDFPSVVDFRSSYNDPQRSVRMRGRVSLVARQDDEGTPWRAKVYVWVVACVAVPMAMLYAAVMLYGGFYTTTGPGDPAADVTFAAQSSANALGTVFVVVALVALGVYTAMALTHRARIPDSHVHATMLNAKYLLLVTLLLATPVVNDFATGLSFGARYALFVVLTAVVLVIIGAAGRADRYLGSVSLGRVVLALALLFVVDVTVYASSPVAPTQTLATPLNFTLAWIGFGSLVWIVVLVVLGALCRPSSYTDRGAAIDAYARAELADEANGEHKALVGALQ